MWKLTCYTLQINHLMWNNCGFMWNLKDIVRVQKTKPKISQTQTNNYTSKNKLTLGSTWSSSPFLIRHKTFWVWSLWILKLRQWRGANHWFHTSVCSRAWRIESPIKITSPSFPFASDKNLLCYNQKLLQLHKIMY